LEARPGSSSWMLWHCKNREGTDEQKQSD
jgi:hypothetical protein